MIRSAQQQIDVYFQLILEPERVIKQIVDRAEPQIGEGEKLSSQPVRQLEMVPRKELTLIKRKR